MSQPISRKIALLSVAAVLLAVAVAWVWPGDNTAFFSSPAISAPTAAPKETPFQGWWDARRQGEPYGTQVQGIITFRGNPTRTFYGTGPIPRTAPQELWRFPKSGGLCAISVDDQGPREWCGTGFTGQPAVFEREGKTWMVVGAYDRALHFLDTKTGERIIDDFPTGDIIKGTVTIDPDGFPLVYTGSRDNYFRVVAFDRGKQPKELWKISADAVSPTMWNDDWDASPLVLDDFLFEGGENGQFHIIKLNRGYDSNGKVTVNPKLVFNTPGWDDQLLKDIKDRNVSIENAVTVVGNIVYFSNSGGLIQGWDISGLKDGKKPDRVFRFWTGDDSDGSIVADEQGFLYVGAEYERGNETSKRNGQMMKLDPRKPDNPLVWKVDDLNKSGGKGGIYDSPALYKDLIIWGTNKGDVIAVDRATGVVRWRIPLSRVHMSPVVVDGVMVVGDCTGILNAYDIADTNAQPKQLWSIKPGACIESTPAVWKGNLYFGTRGGAIHALGLR
ncbi:outer membrane protein assembly factor BamB family protein [Rhizocola hellebori]|uniref:outer membrane protein assembly factor BamB family protein n=1 Tax=Rhizocola hellebori TaxID=1392758 RepID=UPI0019415CC9|nr:PQQ-binding-like beta-propeller repeat protein [Rhizocola hellebori]